jgi:16S rRNA (cytidine1402-2'-O)-methyltransferase
LAKIARERRLVIFFEAPHRIQETLEQLATLVGPDRIVGIGRELTKTHEELVVKPISIVLATSVQPRGEFTVLLSPDTDESSAHAILPDVHVLRLELGRITDNLAVGRRDGVRILAERYGVGVNDLYRLLHGSHDSGV